jgi:serine/threonine protein phosphatase 1
MMRTYAIGVIHGALAKLEAVLARCEADARGAPMSFVFVGDYIDRGPDTRGVIERLMALREKTSVVTLMGNHEALLLEAIDDSLAVDNWVLMQGGRETLASYGVGSPRELPRKHVEWLRALRLSYDDGRRMFVHAGVNPEKPLDAQDDADLLWIREPFLSDARDYGRLIVHGHTPQRSGKPDLRANRVNLDTAAGFGGPVTAAVFTDDETMPIGFLQSDK